MSELRDKLNAVFAAHTAWEDAAAGDPKMEAWDALCETLDAQAMDAMLHLARLEFRRIERLDPVVTRFPAVGPTDSPLEKS